jgi:hypothetical protein
MAENEPVDISYAGDERIIRKVFTRYSYMLHIMHVAN